jgi:peptide/nickel transport system substrate-binding protein
MWKLSDGSRKFFRFLSALVAILMLGTACAPAVSPTPAAEASRPLVVLASDHPGSADPAENWNFGGAAYLPHIYDTLFRFVGEKSPKLTPSLAAEIPTINNGGISKFGLIYTIKLRPGIMFHDGSPVNADAVIFSYERMKALNLGVNGITDDWIDHIEKVNDLTVRFMLKQPFSDFLNSMGSLWGNYIINPGLVRQHEKDGDQGHAWLQHNDAGSGPYTLVSYSDSEITLKRFPKYWAGWQSKKPIEGVEIRWLADPAQARQLLEKGEADIAINLPSQDYADLGKNENFTSLKFPSIMQYYLGMNGSVEPLADPRVRQALQYSFDRDRVIREIFNGNMQKMTAAVGPGYPDVYPAKTQYTFDLEKARSLLNAAGLKNGLDLKINVLHFWPNDTAVVSLWQADLQKIGIRLTINEMDGSAWSSTWFDQCSASSDPSIGQISTMAVGGDYPSAWEVIAQVYPTPRLGGGKCSAVYMDNPLINNIFSNLTISSDPNFRKTLFQNLYDSLAEDDAAIWIGQAVDLITLRNVVQGYQYAFSLGGNYIPLNQMSLTQ